MVLIKFDFVLLITILHVSHCERRIINGTVVSADKSYVVYLVKAKGSDKNYDAWLCGGALVTTEFIITSAACVEDVKFMYAIAGYRKYVPDTDLDKDDCTRDMKKKIVYKCLPVSYEFDFNEIEKWAYIDIALVKVDTPYDLNNPDYSLKCSYTPTIIPINYDTKRQAANLDAMVLGWGHSEIWRQHRDKQNYNQDFLRYGATILYDKNKCKEAYKDYPNLFKIIDKYMICSLEPGHLNDYGIPYSINQDKTGSRTACITQKQKLLGLPGALCEDEIVKNPNQADDTRKHMSLQEKSNNATYKDNGNNILSVNETDYIYKPGFGKIRGYFNRSFSRRNGICQNDHGGPIITWAGKREVLIGVASVFKITADKKCIGPFLYTSTVCNGAFIGCILYDRKANIVRGHNESVSPRDALLCDSDPSVKGFDTIESYVSWKDHPDGPADNERHIGQEQQNKVEHYGTIVQEDSDSNPLKDEEEPEDRFAIKIGPPLNRRPRIRKRPPVQQRPPAQQRPPVQQRPSVQQRPPAQHRLSVQQRPPAQQWHPLQQRPLLQIRPPLQQRPSEINTRLLRIGPPSKRDPQLLNRSPVLKKPPSKINPPPKYAPPPEMNPPPVYALPSEMNPQSVYAPQPEMNPPPVYAPPHEMNPPPVYARPSEMNPPPYRPPVEIRPPPEIEAPTKNGPTTTIIPQFKIEAPEFDEMLDFKSEREVYEKKPNMHLKTANSYVGTQQEFLLRPQSPLDG